MCAKRVASGFNCGFARVAVRELTLVQPSERDNSKRKEAFEKMFGFTAYNLPEAFFEKRKCRQSLFDDWSEKINQSFSKRWQSQEQRKSYMKTFSTKTWEKMSTEDKEQHRLSNCTQCYTLHPELQLAFPLKPAFIPPMQQNIHDEVKKSLISSDTTPQQLGQIILGSLEPLCQSVAGASFCEVIDETPGIKLLKKPSHVEKKRKQRKTLREVKRKLENQYHQRDFNLVMQNRLSWTKYNQIRLETSFETKADTKQRVLKKGVKLRMHGVNDENLHIDKTKLLEEASSWDEETKINWTELATKYGLTAANRGQILKEFLASKNIPLAQCASQPRARRSKLQLGAGISQPQHPTVQTQMNILTQKIENSELIIGNPIAPTLYNSYCVNTQTNTVQTQEVSVYGRQIPLMEVRQKLLTKQLQMGLVRCEKSDLKHEDIIHFLKTININIPTDIDHENLKNLALMHMTTRHLKVWHDHASIAGHGHLLVMVATIYDPAFYYTSEEMAQRGVQIDVQSTVEQPELHILARSRSSEMEQATFNQYRFNCLKELDKTITTPHGTAIKDKLRFFHGDHPAQQFEIGHNVGGHYPCVQCKARAQRFDDVTYCNRADLLTLKDHRDFMLAGSVWRNGSQRPFEGMSVESLKNELRTRNVDVAGKLRPQLIAELEELRQGIATFPALTAVEPVAPLESNNLQYYEVGAVEPLHDFKGHMKNLIAEIAALLPKQCPATDEIKTIKDTVLNKETLRCADYRKAAILLSQALRQTNTDKTLTAIADTAVEMCEILYSHDNKRTRKSILRLTNIAYLHASLCTTTFYSPKCASKRCFFGIYYHSLTSHSPLLYRIISLRSLNAEFQERAFGQANKITADTSNGHPQHIIDNITLRLQTEADRTMTTINQQESEVSKLAKTWVPPPNTFFSNEFINSREGQFQSHLERLSDYLLSGPNIWWKKRDDGVEFFDGEKEPNDRESSVNLCHYRNTTVEQVKEQLFSKWEECLLKNVKLPMDNIRKYNDGDLAEIINKLPPSKTHPTSSDKVTVPFYHQLPTPMSTPAQLPTPMFTSPQLPAPMSTPAQLPTPMSTPAQLPTPMSTPAQLPTPMSTPAQLPTPMSTPAQLLTPLETFKPSYTRPRMSTKLGSTLMKILNDDELVYRFDTLRHNAKKSRDTKLLTQTKALAKQIKCKLMETHRCNIKKLSTIPKDNTNERKEIQHIINICRKVLTTEWNTTP